MTATMPLEPAPVPPRSKDPLGDPALHRTLEDFVRRRVPASDVGDVVQTVLCDALAATERPREVAELRKWVLGVARHKVADFHRRAHREPSMDLPEIEDAPAPMEARALARWAEEQAGTEGEAQRTLDWMAREGEGEKLETIAAEEELPAARVRQRVSRMRRWMKERWMAELAAVATLTVLALAAWWALHNWRRQEEAQPVQPEPSPSSMPKFLPSVPALMPPAPQEKDPQEAPQQLQKNAPAPKADPDADPGPDAGPFFKSKGREPKSDAEPVKSAPKELRGKKGKKSVDDLKKADRKADFVDLEKADRVKAQSAWNAKVDDDAAPAPSSNAAPPSPSLNAPAPQMQSDAPPAQAPQKPMGKASKPGPDRK